MISRQPRKSKQGNVVDPVRSRIMRAVGRSGTGPELAVRKLLHSQGFRFRVQRRDLPGTPDIVLPKYKTVIFVHGCFWHRHENCSKATMPKTRVSFWKEKFHRNVERDRTNVSSLTAAGWLVLTVWECEIREPEELLDRLSKLLRVDRIPGEHPYGQAR